MKEESVYVWQAKVLDNQPKAEGIFELTLSCPQAEQFGLGQFLCLEPFAPESVMARPFSIYTKKRIDSHNTVNWTISLLIKITGKNTQLLSKLKPGQEIKAWGPLGTAINPKDFIHYDRISLVGGGVGIAALCQWQHESKKQGRLREVFYGNRSQSESVTDLDFIGEMPIQLATDDGSLGFHGLVTDLFFQKSNALPGDLVVVCGPKPMMRRMAEICDQKGITCLVSLERTMACGLGVCLGCTIQTLRGPQRICCEGPIFDTKVVRDELSS